MFGFYTKRKVQLGAVKQGKVTDCYQPNICGVACLGNMYGQTKVNGVSTREYNMWSAMINRCYNKNDKYHYQYYGAKGVSVCLRWRCFEYFLQDLPYVADYKLWKNSEPGMYQLDKDTLQKGIPDNEKVYSLATCMFIKAVDNTLEMCNRKNNNTSGYVGVRNYERINGNYAYCVSVAKQHFGTFTDPIAAANAYNRIASRLGYSDLYMNNVPYMSRSEVDMYKITKPDDDGMYELCRVIRQ